MKRRAFLKGAGGLLTLMALGTESSMRTNKHDLVEDSRIVMGAANRILAFGEDRAALSRTVDSAYDLMWHLEDKLTIFRESEITRLNRERQAWISHETEWILRKSLSYSGLTKGAFDAAGGHYPDLEVRDGWARFVTGEGTVDLGGIGVGYGVDKAASLLKERGVGHAIIDGGGEILAIGSKPDGDPWRIGIKDPREEGGSSGIIELVDKAVSTSGNYREAHIYDPRTHLISSGVLMATVLAEKAVTADALSTAVFVMGAEEGPDLLDTIPGVEGMVIDPLGKAHYSKGFQDFLAD